MKVIEVAAAVIRRGNRVLLASRPAGKPPAGWEFPGGKIEPGESANRALARELEEELGLHAFPADQIYRLETVKGDQTIRLHFIRVLLEPEAQPVAREGQEFEWRELVGEAPAELLPPDRPVWDFLTNFGRG